MPHCGFGPALSGCTSPRWVWEAHPDVCLLMHHSTYDLPCPVPDPTPTQLAPITPTRHATLF